MVQAAAVFSASDLSKATIFGLGIMPYISASIIFQLLGSVWKPIEELQKEGESGRKKINEYTRYATVVLCLVQSWFYVQYYIMSKDPATGIAPLVNPNFVGGSGELDLEVTESGDRIRNADRKPCSLEQVYSAAEELS